MAVRVFEVNDCEWWAADCTPDELLLAYMIETGVTHEDATGDASEYPRPLSERELDALMFKEDIDGETVRFSFREQLNRMIGAGTPLPTLFAARDY